MPDSGSNKSVAYGNNSDVPNHPQPTNFMHVEHPVGGPDEMCIAKGMEQMVTNGESAITSFRTPY